MTLPLRIYTFGAIIASPLLSAYYVTQFIRLKKQIDKKYPSFADSHDTVTESIFVAIFGFTAGIVWPITVPTIMYKSYKQNKPK